MVFEQRQAEWLDEHNNYAYHMRQFEKPYNSTVRFADWLEEIGVLDQSVRSRVLDVGCGAGANIYYFRKRFTECVYSGLELNDHLVIAGNSMLKQLGMDGSAMLRSGDLYKLDSEENGDIDCLLSLQTLSWLPDFKRPLESFCSLNPKWVCLTSLFYDGPLSCRIEVIEHNKKNFGDVPSFYNIYSLSEVSSYLNSLGYEQFHFKKFDIDIDLPRPESGELGTYTEQTLDGRRLQISGPLLMPWYFLAAKRTTTYD